MKIANRVRCVSFVAAALLSTTLQAQTILKRDPPASTLRSGQVVLVDDGSCPKGQIKELTGGSNRTYMTNAIRRGFRRTHRCIPKK